VVESDCDKALRLLRWAIDWIDFCGEIPVPQEEPDDLEMFVAARSLLAGDRLVGDTAGDNDSTGEAQSERRIQ
jgi:hypothetical protein